MKPQNINSLGDVLKHMEQTSQLEALKTEIRVTNNKEALYKWGDEHAGALKQSSELKRVFRDKLDEIRKANYIGTDSDYFKRLQYLS